MGKTESKGTKTSSMGIWIPVIVAIISGVFALWQASLSGKSAQDAEKIVSSNLPLPVGTIVASFLKPKDFYKQMDGRETFDKNKSTWCFANGEENITNTPYYDLSGSTKIENLQGYFLRGLDKSGKIDPHGKQRSLGSKQKDALEQHIHHMTETITAAHAGNKAGNQGYQVGPKSSNFDKTQGIASDTISTETRPKNIAVNYYIKIR